MARSNRYKRRSSGGIKLRLLLWLLAPTLVVALLWNQWSEQEPTPRMLAYGEQATRSDWPQLTSASSFTDTGDLLKSNYYVILDGSISMNQEGCGNDKSNTSTRMSDAIDALSAFMDAVPREANIGAAVFNHNEIVELMALQGGQRIRNLQISPGGPARLRSAILSAYAKLELQGQAQLGYGEYHLVVISGSDAADVEDSNEDPGSVLRDILSTSPIHLTTIGYCTGPDHNLDPLPAGSYTEASSLEALTQALNTVLSATPSFTVDSFHEPAAAPVSAPGKVAQDY